MNERILCVDDDSHVLASFRRILHKHFSVEIANDGKEALRLLRTNGPFAVVISDMHMPVMDGISLLTRVKDEYPLSVRMMLTGDSDQRTAMDAVNESSIFRFLTKPCLPDVLIEALDDGVRQYRLQVAERGLLDNTLGGCVRILIELLSLSDPQTFARAKNLRERIQAVTKQLGHGDTWVIEIAAMLAPIGSATIPPVVLMKSRAGHLLNDIERDILRRAPAIGHQLLATIPRLEGVARVVLYQNKDFNGGGFPTDPLSGADIPIGARILRVLMDLSLMEADGLPLAQAAARLAERTGRYDPAVLDAVTACLPIFAGAREIVRREVLVGGLRTGQVLRSDIRTIDGSLLLASGHAISPAILERVVTLGRIQRIVEPILVEESIVQQPSPAPAGTPAGD